jgi:hypothetical protein
MPHDIAYFKDTDTNDPRVFPIRSDEVLKRFPSALLLTATRDQSLSSVVHMHSRLVALGVEAQLHIWEGLGHDFFADPDLPQSREMYDVTVKFFDSHLGPKEPFICDQPKSPTAVHTGDCVDAGGCGPCAGGRRYGTQDPFAAHRSQIYPVPDQQ